MRAIDNLVRKFKKAVTGVEEPARPEAKPFQWEPAAVMAAPVPAKGEASPGEAAPAAAVPASWKRAQAEASSVIGAGIPADVSDFATVYKGAGVQAPSHGYGVDRVAGMLSHKTLAGLDRSVKSSAVLAALDAAGVPLGDLLHDGLLRYKALVAFEAAKELELHGLRHRNERRVEELKAASETFQKKKTGEIDALTRETAGAVAALTRLKSRQRTEEERFHRTVSLFVEAMPARIIPMPAKPLEAPAPGTGPLEAKADLRLVSPAAALATPPTTTPKPEAKPIPPTPAEPPAAARPDDTVLFKPEAQEPAKPQPADPPDAGAAGAATDAEARKETES